MKGISLPSCNIFYHDLGDVITKTVFTRHLGIIGVSCNKISRVHNQQPTGFAQSWKVLEKLLNSIFLIRVLEFMYKSLKSHWMCFLRLNGCLRQLYYTVQATGIPVFTQCKLGVIWWIYLCTKYTQKAYMHIKFYTNNYTQLKLHARCMHLS